MSQHTLIMTDGSGAEFLVAINAALQALGSNSKGTARPTTVYDGQIWIDSSASPWKVYWVSGVNNVLMGLIDPSANVFIPYAGLYPMNDDRFKNRLINGDFGIDTIKTTHNPGASFSLAYGAARVQTADLWLAACTGANVTVQQIAGSGRYRNALQFTGASGVTGLTLCQRIRGQNIRDLVAALTTLSGCIWSSTLTSVTWKAYYADALDNFATRTQFATGSVNITGVATDYTIANITQHASAGNGIEIEFSVGAFTSGTLTFTGIQLELGSVRSMFEVLDIGSQRRRCQEQYCVVDEAGQVPVNGGYVLQAIPFPVEMRTTPTMANITAGTISNCSVVSEAAVSARGCNLGVLSSAANGYVTGRVSAYSCLL